jgi:hypothetical protein
MSLKIITGGQTGADRAALDAALELGAPCGGWCPGGRQAEDGPISDHYPLTELPGAGYRQRTRQNVIDSDATLIVSFGPPENGSAKTARYAHLANKPLLIIDAKTMTYADAARAAQEFITKHEVKILNIAGPRSSKQSAIYNYVKRMTIELLTNYVPNEEKN